MARLYYIARNGEQAGPFTTEQLPAQDLQPDTLVWTEGMAQWTPARQVPELAPLFAHDGTPPPVTPAMHWPEPEKYFGYTLAGRGDRFVAALITGIVNALLIGICTYTLLDSDSSGLITNALGVVIVAVIGCITYPLWSGTLGHYLMGIKVISAKDGCDMNEVADGLGREALKAILGIFILPSIWLLWDPDKQNLYDKITNTFVVRDTTRNT